jgi:hypothetical protein
MGDPTTGTFALKMGDPTGTDEVALKMGDPTTGTFALKMSDPTTGTFA